MLLYIPKPAVTEAPTAMIRLIALMYHRPARKPRRQRLAPSSERIVRPLVGSKPSPSVTASRWISKPSMSKGGKVYVNCMMQSAATKLERALRRSGCACKLQIGAGRRVDGFERSLESWTYEKLGIAAARRKARVQYTGTKAAQIHFPFVDPRSGRCSNFLKQA
jgi:hypothetical protein